MNTGLFAVDGIDVAGLVAEHLGPRILPLVLHRPGAPAARDLNNLTQAPVPGPGTDFPCRGFIEDFSSYDMAQGLVEAGDRKVIILGGTLSTEPLGGIGRDQVTVEGKRWSIQRVIDRDPAGATFTLHVRNV